MFKDTAPKSSSTYFIASCFALAHTDFSSERVKVPRSDYKKTLAARRGSYPLNSFPLLLGCVAPLGMDSGAITDAQITASSQWNDNHAARQARLHFKKAFGKQGSWSSRTNDLKQWLQIDLGQYTTVTRIATQGRHGTDPWDQYVTAYKLQYSYDGVTFQFYKETQYDSEKVCLYSPYNLILRLIIISKLKYIIQSPSFAGNPAKPCHDW